MTYRMKDVEKLINDAKDRARKAFERFQYGYNNRSFSNDFDRGIWIQNILDDKAKLNRSKKLDLIRVEETGEPRRGGIFMIINDPQLPSFWGKPPDMSPKRVYDTIFFKLWNYLSNKLIEDFLIEQKKQLPKEIQNKLNIREPRITNPRVVNKKLSRKRNLKVRGNALFSFNSSFSDDELEILHKELIPQFIDSGTQLKDFKKVFQNKPAASIQKKIIWVAPSKNRVEVSKRALISLLRILGENDFIPHNESVHQKYAEGCLFEKLRLCFRSRSTKNFTFHNANVDYSQYDIELENIIKKVLDQRKK